MEYSKVREPDEQWKTCLKILAMSGFKRDTNDWRKFHNEHLQLRYNQKTKLWYMWKYFSNNKATLLTRTLTDVMRQTHSPFKNASLPSN